MLQWDRYLVQVIKAKLGPEITKNFEAMLQDVQLCYEKKYEFKHFLENSGKEVADNDKMDLESDMIKQQPQSQTHLQNLPAVCVTVLSKCEWQIPVEQKFKVPDQIDQIQKTYERFYKLSQNNVNKNIDWIYYYGTVEVKYNLPDGKSHFIVMKPYQYFILNLFENGGSISYKEIVSNQQVMNLDDFSKIMESLCTGKYQMLVRCDKERDFIKKEEDTQQIAPIKYEYEDLWMLNPNFKSKLKRFTLKEPKFADTMKDSSVDAERKYAIESCLVRVMKSRKILNHQELINDVMKLQLKFSPDSKDVKKGIESLIKKEFLERDTTDMNSLRYIA